jgi:tetratricopeptide (TPR) repeat protein
VRSKSEARLPFDGSVYSYAGKELLKHWAALHNGDREPYPTAQRIAQLAKAHPAVVRSAASHGGAAVIAGTLQEAWRAFHAGDFLRATQSGMEQGAFGAAVSNKAAAIHTLYVEKDERRCLDILKSAIERGERAVEQLPDCPNAHYTLALVLGRYSQRISIVEALAAGFAGRILERLERTLKLEPRHAEAHVALGLYHAEIVGKLGGLAARLTYGASQDAAIENFRKATKLAPTSAIAHVEYAHGLLLMDAAKHRKEAEKLYALAAAHKPLDVMERFDVERARRNGAPA